VYETFDWRFLAAGSVLEHRRGGDHSVLVWRDLASGEVLGQLPVDTVPSFVWHLPDAPVVARLARVTEVRALMPLATFHSTFDARRLVDDEGKTLARLTLERTSVRKARELPAIIELAPVRGYDAEADGLAALLAAQVNVVPEPDDPVLLGLRAVGFAPGSYSSKLRLDLDPASSAHDAWITVLRALFAIIQANEAGLRDDVDSEFLHDFRVAVRRTRSVLADAKGVIGPDVRAWARNEFRWLGQITSPPRDADVFVLSMPDFEAALPADRRDDLKPFQAYLEEHRREVHGNLVEALDGARARALVERWSEVLEAPPPSAPDAPDASRPAAHVAGRHIRRAHARVIKAGRAINASSHPEELHQLRKDAKRLRYLLECFGSLYPVDVVTPVVRELKGLQDVLGAYQDAQVQAEAIERFGQEMIERRGALAATLLAMGAVVEQLELGGREARKSFADRFQQFDDRDVRRSIDLIAAGEAAEGAA
jgi:CHAD domain-containing protein